MPREHPNDDGDEHSASAVIIIAVIVLAVLGLSGWFWLGGTAVTVTVAPSTITHSATPPNLVVPLPGDGLLEGYGDTAADPIEDLRKLHRVVTGYFSVIKDGSRFPIGGNEDLAAALRGENPNREPFVTAENPVFSAEGLLIDRWGRPLVVHPIAWRQIELRSAGPDGVPFNADDLIVAPNGNSITPE